MDNKLPESQHNRKWNLDDENRKLRPGEIAWLELNPKPKAGDTYKGKIIAKFDERGYPISTESRHLVFGYLVEGNTVGIKGGGRPKGSRNKLTQEMLDVVSRLDISPAQFLAQVLHNPNYSLDNQIKAAMKLTDIVYPKAASVELEVLNDEPTSAKEIDDRIKHLLSDLQASIDIGEDSSNGEEESED